jgi:hypothetical protein
MRAIAVLITVLFLGCLIGAAGSWLRYGNYGNIRQVDGRQGDSSALPRRYYEQRLSELLELTPEQKARFENVMKKSRQELDALSKEQRLKIGTVIEETNKEIYSILNAEQEAKLEAFLNDINSRRERERGTRGERGSGLPPKPQDRGRGQDVQ